MTELVINSGRKISGRMAVQGSKNSALPLLAAALLVPGEVIFENCPSLSDVDCALEILTYLGCSVKREGAKVSVNCAGMNAYNIPERLMKRMRSSVVFLGGILARTGRAEMAMPGGCLLGPRPIDYHIGALRALGANIDYEGERLVCRAERLRGRDLFLPFPSVGATENAMLAAAAAEGTTRIMNAAREPEICDLAGFMNAIGVEVTGAGSSVVEVAGRCRTHSARYTVMTDRIAVGTYLCAAAATGGEIELSNAVPEHIYALTEILRRAGCEIEIGEGSYKLSAPRVLSSAGIIETLPYPGFATDMQPALMAMLCGSAGLSVFIENIFESRYNHIDELLRMGANIKHEGHFAAIYGVPRLTGCPVTALDLRAGAALVTAGLAAYGETHISHVDHIDRGYERLDEVLCELGADVVRKN
jgi:UDP-N-acetylglucosamine 1-carboxyvinyltransferase